MSSALIVEAPRPASPPARASAWINGPRWDVGWLIGTAAVVPLVLLGVWLNISSVVLNIGVAALVGGPHVWSTYLATYADPRFRRAHLPILAAAAVLVPAFVVTMTLANFQILLSVFIFAASIHVLQQNAYLTDIYRARAAQREPAWSRWIDYGFLGLSFYPIAAYRLVHDTFLLGDIPILIPWFVKFDATWIAVSAAFGALGLAWAAKTVVEWRRGTLNVPKTLLIGVTTTVAFLVPAAAAGERLELAFQAVNMWHSIQYLAIVWFILKVRKQQGLLENRFVASVSGRGRARRFYGACLVLTLGVVVAISALVWTDPLRIRWEQYYYMVALSVLLVHYVIDGYLFAVSNRASARFETNPYTAPAAA